jgi:hypothetical protein
MEQKEHIKELILEAQKKAAVHALSVRHQVPLTKAFLYEALRRYIMCKYLLEDGDCISGEDCFCESLDALAERSLAKSLSISKDLVQEFDIARSCAGGSSAMTKKVLLLLAIQRDFYIYLPTEGTGRIKTITDLSELVWDAMGEKEFWKPFLQSENTN